MKMAKVYLRHLKANDPLEIKIVPYYELIEKCFCLFSFHFKSGYYETHEIIN